MSLITIGIFTLGNHPLDVPPYATQAEVRLLKPTGRSVKTEDFKKVSTSFQFLFRKKRFGPKEHQALMNLVKVLSTDQSNLRSFTQLNVQRLLTFWVRSRSSKEWHSDAIVDRFFQHFKGIHCENLRLFLIKNPYSPEVKYLAEL